MKRAKVKHHTATPLGTFTTPNARFDHIHLDIVGPLPPSQGCRYLLTCIDRFTRWPEAIPVSDITAKTVARAFVTHWISTFGVPSTVTTDHGTQFESSLFTALTNLLGTKRIRTTANHQCPNGMVERFHRQLKACLKASSDSSKWTELLPLILLSLRTTFKQDLLCTPVQLVYGTTLRLPGQFFIPSPATMPLDPTLYADRLSSYMHQLRPVPPRLQSPPSHAPSNLSTCTHVFVRHDAIRKPLDPPYDGPYQILSRHTKHFILDIHGKQISFMLDRLKPAHLDSAFVNHPPATLYNSPTSDNVQPKPLLRTTPSGRRLHFPDRYGTA